MIWLIQTTPIYIGIIIVLFALLCRMLCANKKLKRMLAQQTQTESITANLSIGEPSLSAHIPDTEPDWLSQLNHFIDQYLHEPDFNKNKLGEALGLSSRQILRRLKHHRDQTFSQYLYEYRLEKARRLLESHPEMTVKNVALAVGLRDAKYFSREFKKRFGYSPGEHRDQQKAMSGRG